MPLSEVRQEYTYQIDFRKVFAGQIFNHGI